MAETLLIDSGNTAFMLISTALVLMMLMPGLALFYGGLVRAKNLLSVLSQVLGVGAIAMLCWVLWLYSLVFGGEGAFIGDFSKLGMVGIDGASAWAVGDGAIPELVFAAFQMTFAAITAALIVGALVERVRFGAIMAFAFLWLTLVYAPIAHMVWGEGGLLIGMGAIDFAGGTVVHINAGIAGVVGVLFAGARIGHLKEAMPPHALGLTMVGAGLLWVGWIGFNAGSALEANGLAGIAMMNTLVAPAAGVLAWMGAERLRFGKPSMLGGASGAIAGLVAITPAAGISGPLGAILLGAVSSLACYLFVTRTKAALKLDDSLDVFGIHGLGGIVGSIGTALVALPMLGGHGGEEFALLPQLGVQTAAVLIAIAWSAIGSALCFGLVKLIMPLRHERDGEREGLDIADHGERAYNL